MPLQLDSLRDANQALRDALDVSVDAALTDGLDPRLKRIIQSGVIQHFEFTYELSWKFIRRWLDMNIGRGVADGVSRQEFFRIAAQQGLIDSVERWMRYHRARNDTSHTYRRETADAVFEIAPDFLRDSTRLLKALEARND